MQLKLVAGAGEEADDGAISGLAGGCCFDFNRVHEHLFLVGTEEGKIHKCSKAYSGQYLETFLGHHMAVYSIRWNPFHAGVFLSCSADWTVKLWSHNQPTPVLSFDLGNAVGDVAWAPYVPSSSSVLSSPLLAHPLPAHPLLASPRLVSPRLAHPLLASPRPSEWLSG